MSTHQSPRVKSNKLGRALLLAIVCAAAGMFFWFNWNARRNSAISFLPERRGAEWIVYPTPFFGSVWPRIELETKFRREFRLERVPQKAQVSWYAFIRASVAINGTLLPGPQSSNRNWKDSQTVSISELLHAGTNSIEVTAVNEAGPPALWLLLQGDDLSIRSDAAWEASYAGATLRPAKLAKAPAQILPGSPLYASERGVASFVAHWPEMLLFTAVSAFMLAAGSWGFKRIKAAPQTFGSGWLTDPAAVCLAGIILLWIFLFVHNANLLPRSIGFDIKSHLDYINYIQERGRLPLANEGAVMYNPPLYYLLCAGLLAAAGLNANDVAGVIVLRYFGLLIGIVHLLLVFGSLRLIFPRQTGRQIIGLLLAGFVPAQLYLSHYITNELLAGMLVTATLYACLRALQDQEPSPIWFAGVGAVLGLALLTKFTAVLVIPFVFGAIVFRFLASPAPVAWRSWLKCTSLAILACLVICGWHYGRVWIHFGKPLLGNWEASSGLFGWQDPGYRTAAYFTRFGLSVDEPFSSGHSSLADALYSTLWGDGYCGGISGMILRPPWNYELMSASYLLALLPTVLIGLGAVVALVKFIRNPRPEGLLLNGLAWSFIAALIHMALKFPTYALIKAFYGLLIMLPVCSFGALGWDFLARRSKLLWSTLSIFLATWALCTFSSYWIGARSAQANLLKGIYLTIDEKTEEAVPQLVAALAAEPTNFMAKAVLADSLTALGQKTAGERLHNELLASHPNAARSQLELALTSEKEGKLAEAVEHTRRAVAAAPEDAQGYALLATRLIEMGQSDQAVRTSREGLRVVATDSELQYLLGISLLQHSLSSEPQSGTGLPQSAAAISSVSEEAFRHLRLACKLSGNSWQSLNGLAWVLATHPQAEYRNGVEAVQLAEQACQMTGYRQPKVLCALAVAYAEAGRFPEAITTVQRAQALARELGQIPPPAIHEEWLRLFKGGQAYRDRQMRPPR